MVGETNEKHLGNSMAQLRAQPRETTSVALSVQNALLRQLSILQGRAAVQPGSGETLRERHT